MPQHSSPLLLTPSTTGLWHQNRVPCQLSLSASAYGISRAAAFVDADTPNNYDLKFANYKCNYVH